MADFDYVLCPHCQGKFMVGEEFFRLPEAYCHCPYCGTEFRVGVAATKASADRVEPGIQAPRGKRST